MRECGEIDQEARIDEAAWRLVENRHIGPRARCFICGRRLTDPVSVSYGIDLACWRELVAAIHGESDYHLNTGIDVQDQPT